MESANDPEILHSQLLELKIEHRDLDEAIERFGVVPPEDDLLVRRLKKRKLQLKDRIATLERLLNPDELA